MCMRACACAHFAGRLAAWSKHADARAYVGPGDERPEMNDWPPRCSKAMAHEERAVFSLPESVSAVEQILKTW